MLLLLLSLSFANILAAPLQPAQEGDQWLQVCCQDNDVNGNGGISFKEFTQFALNLVNLDRKELEHVFLEGDVDKNSDLDGDECIEIRRLLKTALQRKGTELLKKYDHNNDHKLSKNESEFLADVEFDVSFNESDTIFPLADKDLDGFISTPELSTLLIYLRQKAIEDGKEKLASFDKNHNGVVSYEEIKADILRDTDGFTLKQLFKTIDFDKNYHLSVVEFMALEQELAALKENQTRTVTPKIIHIHPTMSTTLKTTARSELKVVREKRETVNEEKVGIQVAPARAIHEFSHDAPSMEEKEEVIGVDGMIQGTKDGSMQKASELTKMPSRFIIHRKKREEAETAPPPLGVTTELPPKLMRALSLRAQNNLSGGQRGPSIADSVTVPYDDKDFE